MLISSLMAGPPGQAQQTETAYRVLYNFTGGADGANPKRGLIADPTRKLLVGTTESGGAYLGVVFELSLTGQETVLYSFRDGAADGYFPSGLIRDASGNFYGTTAEGGNLDDCGGAGCGVVFRLSPDGQETVLYSFSSGSDGFWPVAGLIRDAAGNLYGTTTAGGPYCADDPDYGCGVVFKVSATGEETVLYSFTGGTDGSMPTAGVIRTAAGNLYGTTANGGNLNCPGDPGYGCGAVFKLSPTGQKTVLHSFTGGADGAFPASLIRDGAGNLYGTTMQGGALSYCSGSGCGVVFKLGPTGQETVLHSFTGGAAGNSPYALIRDSAGNFYGTAAGGNLTGSCASNYPPGCGVVFKLDLAGNKTVLYAFTGGANGSNPEGVVRDSAGNLYGTTSSGGDLSGCNGLGCGVVFKLTP
jgi:uncharacterized repeat protein (TIGR03803 family)